MLISVFNHFCKFSIVIKTKYCILFIYFTKQGEALSNIFVDTLMLVILFFYILRKLRICNFSILSKNLEC